MIDLVCPLGQFPLAVMSRKQLVNVCPMRTGSLHEQGATPFYLCHFEKLWDSRHSSEEFLIDVQAFFTLGFLHVKVLLCTWEKGMKSDFEIALHSHHTLWLQAELCLASVVTTWPEATLTSMSAFHKTLIQHVTTERSHRMQLSPWTEPSNTNTQVGSYIEIALTNTAVVI